MTQHYHANAGLDLEALERKLETDSRDLSLFWHRQFLGLIQRLRDEEAENKQLWGNLHGEQAESRRRIAELEARCVDLAFVAGWALSEVEGYVIDEYEGTTGFADKMAAIYAKREALK